jgi:hypothetical protein
MMAFEDTDTRNILAFLDRIGIPVAFETVAGDTFLPAMTVRGGTLLVDAERLAWPGDLLHEAGHIAVTDPALRPTLDAVSQDPAEEMAAIAWSYAAAVAIGVDAAVVFHAEGYRGGGKTLAEDFSSGHYFGESMLHYFGMSVLPRHAEKGVAPYPHMLRWVR